MLTLAEEIGLGGYQLASRVRKAFLSLADGEVAALMRQVRERSAKRHLVYLRDGQAEVVGLFPLPLTALPDQLIDVRVRTNYGKVVSTAAGWLAAALAGGIIAKLGEDAFAAALSAALKAVTG